MPAASPDLNARKRGKEAKMHSIQPMAVQHRPFMEDRYTRQDGTVVVRLHTARGDFDRALARVASNYEPGEFEKKARSWPMTRMWQSADEDLWQLELQPEDPRLLYDFLLEGQRQTWQFDADGLGPVRSGTCFHYHHAWPHRALPEWAQGRVGYQIFPDRFRRGNAAEPGEKLEPWQSRRVQNQYRFGGNIQGMIEAVPYLHDLGVTLVYMTPIFLSDTSHRYNTFDYYQVDPLLGTKEDLTRLAQALHERGMRLILDGVFNHCGLGFAPFKEALKNEKSRYRDWFLFGDWPCGYLTFGKDWAYMPKLNTENPEVIDYFCDVGEYWLREAGIDGWRLDVSPEVSSRFWRCFRERILRQNPEAIMVAECWDDSREWLCTDLFDSTMNYVTAGHLWNAFADHTLSMRELDERLNADSMRYPDYVTNSLWTFLDSHDTPRIRTRCRTDRDMRAAVFCQMTLPGVPIVYYGDELGMRGGMDPQCRRPMTWDQTGNAWHRFYKDLIAIRNAHPALLRGDYRTVQAGDCLAFERTCREETLLCLLNPTARTQAVRIPVPGETGSFKDLITGKTAGKGTELALRLRPGQGMILARTE